MADWALMSKKLIIARHVKKNGLFGWAVTIPKRLNGGIVGARRYFGNDHEAAKQFAAKLQKQSEGIDGQILCWPSDIKHAVVAALKLLGLQRAGEIVEAVKCYLKYGTKEQRTLAEAVKECVAAKIKSGKRASYTTAFANTLARFAKGRARKLIDQISATECESFINRPAIKRRDGKIIHVSAATRTRKNRQIDLRTLFSFAVKRGYCSENPIERLESITEDEKTPEIFTVDQAKTLLTKVRALYPQLLPFLVLCLFGGLRPSEAQRLTWDDIGPDVIRINAGRSKGRRVRFVTVNPTLRAWLNLGGELPTTEPRSRKIRKLIQPWPQDVLRHSFVSYSYAIHGAKHTAQEAGHSEDILHRKYRALVSKAEAERFWNLLP